MLSVVGGALFIIALFYYKEDRIPVADWEVKYVFLVPFSLLCSLDSSLSFFLFLFSLVVFP